MAGSEAKKERKLVQEPVRICVRKDGVFFSWNEKLELKSEMSCGYLLKYDDGTQEITFDHATRQTLESKSTSERERILLEQNADLRKRLAEMQGLAPLGDVETPLEPVETLTPTVASAERDDTPLADEESIEFAEPPVFSPSKLQAMRKSDLIAQVQAFAPDLEIPEMATKDDLVAICLDVQSKAAGA